MNIAPRKLLLLAAVFVAVIVGLWIYQSAENHGGEGFSAGTSDKATDHNGESQDSAAVGKHDSNHGVTEADAKSAMDSRQPPQAQNFRNPSVESRIIRDGGL